MASFTTTTVSDIIDDINYTYLLPAIQREFVWDENQMLDLFDSIVRQYPIGSFLFWRVSGDYAEDRIKYKFTGNYIEEPIYPDELDEVSYHNMRYLDEYNNTPNKLNLVLDGQQRLSTLFIGLKGTLTTRAYNQRRNRVDSWTRTQLYMNVLSSPDIEKSGRKYEFRFKKPNPETTRDEYWYRVSSILDTTEPTQEVNRIIRDVKEIEGIKVETVDNLRGIVQRNISSLHMAINEREIIPYFTEKEENQEKVLDIFIRTNEGGTQLSKSDVLLSIATAHWQSGDPEVVARDEIGKFVDKLNKHPVRGGITFSSNFVLRTLLSCADENLVFSLENFSDAVLSSIKGVWIDEKYKKSVIQSLDLLTSFGFTTSHVQSKSTLLPVVYYFYSNDNPSLSWESKQGRKNRSHILFWLASMVITGEMSTGGTIQTIQAIRDVIQENASGDFPLKEIESRLQDYNKSMGFDEDTIERWTGRDDVGRSRTRVFLSLLYFPEIADERHEYELDHIFPRAEMDKSTLVEEHGYDPYDAERVSKLSDSIANIQLIRKSENREKSSTSPKEWLRTRTPQYISRHYIPRDESTYSIEEAEQFLKKREGMIKEELIGKTPDRSDLEPTVPEM